MREEIKYSSKFKPMPYAKEFINKISKKCILGIASSGSRQTVELSLKKLNLIHYFNYILCSEDVKRGKPSPEIFLKIINLAKFKPEEALIFEDSYNGIKASKAAKISGNSGGLFCKFPPILKFESLDKGSHPAK